MAKMNLEQKVEARALVTLRFWNSLDEVMEAS